MQDYELLVWRLYLLRVDMCLQVFVPQKQRWIRRSSKTWLQHGMSWWVMHGQCSKNIARGTINWFYTSYWLTNNPKGTSLHVSLFISLSGNFWDQSGYTTWYIPGLVKYLEALPAAIPNIQNMTNDRSALPIFENNKSVDQFARSRSNLHVEFIAYWMLVSVSEVFYLRFELSNSVSHTAYRYGGWWSKTTGNNWLQFEFFPEDERICKNTKWSKQNIVF